MGTDGGGTDVGGTDASGTDAAAETGRARLWVAPEARAVPLQALLTTIAVIVLTYLSAKLVYRLRGVILLLVVAGFVALLLNPLVVVLTRWVRRRGIAVAIVTLLALLLFAGLAF